MAESMVFAYARVSSKKGQKTDRQVQAITEYASEKGITISRIFEEAASGKNFNRDVYQSMKLALRRGDTLIIKELDRLGRNMAQIKDEWRELEQSGIDIIVIDTELLNTANKTDLEKTLISSIVFELLAYMAEKERLRIKSRQAEGIALAKAGGDKYKGRKPISVDPIEFERVYAKWRAKEISAVKAMELLAVKKDVFYRLVKGYGAGTKTE